MNNRNQLEFRIIGLFYHTSVRQCWLILLLLFSPAASGMTNAIDSFSLERKKDVTVTAAGFLLCGIGYYFYHHAGPPDSGSLNENNLLCFDRFAIQCRNDRSAVISDVTMGICSLMPLLTACSVENNEHVRTRMCMTVESYLINAGIATLVKGITRRARPYVYRSGYSAFKKRDAQSFFSFHSSIAFNGAVLAGTMFQEQNKNSQWIAPIWIAGLGAATATGIFRVTSGNHFPTDVIAGAIIGSVIGYGIIRLHQ